MPRRSALWAIIYRTDTGVMGVLVQLHTMSPLQTTRALTLIVLISQCMTAPPLRGNPPDIPSDDPHGMPGEGPEPKLETFTSVEDLCQWLCDRPHPQVTYGCPPSCSMAMLSQWSKRSVRRRFDDFSFDDYLFMKLLGRNLGEKQ